MIHDVAVIKQLFQVFTIPVKFERLLWDAGEMRFGRPWIFLRDFALLFPDFPIYLQAAQECWLPTDRTWPRMLQSQQALSLNRFDEVHEELGQVIGARRLGIVMSCPHLNGKGGVCMHDFEGNASVPGPRLVYCAENGRQFTAEAFAQLLGQIDWQPPASCTAEHEERFLGQVRADSERWVSTAAGSRPPKRKYFWDEE